MHMISKHLLVGNIDNANDPPPQVGALLLVAEEYTVVPAPWLAYAHIPLKEFAEASPTSLAQAVDWVERRIKHNRVMVCCRAGMGRSVSVALAYLCCVEGLPYPEALKLVMARRPGAVPLPNIEATIEEVRRIRAQRIDPSGSAAVPSQPTPGPT